MTAPAHAPALDRPIIRVSDVRRARASTVGRGARARAEPPIVTQVFAIPYGDAYIVYAPLRRLAFVANASAVNTVARLREDRIAAPTEEQATFTRFLEAIGLTGADGDRPVAGLHDATYKPTEVTLFMTSQCNLRCVYCYAQAGDLPATRMALETAKRGIDYIVANALERQTGAIGVHYHGGGEPTVNHAVLTASHAYARELAERHGLRLTAGIATNGVLAPRMRQWIIEHLTGASVSLDGAPEVNDLNRPTVSGAGSGAKVMETLQAFDAAGFHYGVRVTVSARTVDQMADTVRYILDHCAPARLQIEPVYDIGRGHAADLHVDSAAFIRGYRACWEIAHARGIELLYSSARIDTLSERFCRAYGEGFSLTPRGSVSGCYEVHDEAADFAGDVLFGAYDEAAGTYVLDDAKLARMRGHGLRGQSWCDGCFARYHCSGDCPNKTRHAAGDGVFTGMPSCDITRNLVLDQLVRKIEGAGGTAWVERVPAASD